MDRQTRDSVSRIPLMQTKAGPRDGGDLWVARLKEEYRSLIQYVEQCRAADSAWFNLESNAQGTRWFGQCWTYHANQKYTFDVEFDLPAAYPSAPPEIALPQLDGKSAKMYRGGKICLSSHFMPLWARNVPVFGISHLLALGLGPWLAVEVPVMVEEGALLPPDAERAAAAAVVERHQE